MSLVVTGSIGIDTIIGPHGTVENVMGGSASYFAAAAGFFCPVRLVAAVGDDWPADHSALLSRFEQIDTAGLEERAGSKTFRWTGKYHEDMNIRETMAVDIGVLAEEIPPVPPAFADSRLVFLANTDPINQLKFAGQFAHADLIVADTMDRWIETQPADLEALLATIHGLVINDSEAAMLVPEAANTIVAAKAIQRRYDLGFVVVKKGEHGAILVHRDGLAVLPSYPADQVIDPTGAGDTFAGGFMGYLACSAGDYSVETLQRAMAYGTVVASFTIESFSLDRLAGLTRQEIDDRLAEMARIVRISMPAAAEA
ncbi:MAG: sugar kinase [Planctomycetes bacterium]|nr:sugar kinase [Planctomycetota bacterium]NOG52796.1 sugar kinase [Planctomycetota bacterium]